MPKRNGTRHPQSYRAASGRSVVTSRPAAEPKSRPQPTLNGCQLQRKALLFGVPYSEMNVSEEPNSPPVAKPCSRRSTVSRIGARIPTWEYVGKHPMSMVHTPMHKIVNVNALILPCLSAYAPIRMPPIGRTRKPVPKTRKLSRRPTIGSSATKKSAEMIAAKYPYSP